VPGGTRPARVPGPTSWSWPGTGWSWPGTGWSWPGTWSNHGVEHAGDDHWGPRQWLRVRLIALAFLGFLVLPAGSLLTSGRPAGWLAYVLAGLAVFAGCYARVTWRVVPAPHALRSPYALAAGLAAGIALVPVLGFGWATGLAFYGNALLLLDLPRRWWPLALGATTAGVVCAGALFHVRPTEIAGNLVSILVVAALQAAFFRQIQDTAALRRARGELARLAVSEERLRIARDLHDVLGQRLSAVALKSELAGRLVRRDPDRAEAELTEIAAVAREALAEVRATVSGYRDTSLAGEVRTAASLLRAASVATTVSGVPVGLPSAVEQAAAWVVREASTNVVRHAKAARCRVVLGRQPDGLLVEVADDGPTAGGGGPAGGRDRPGTGDPVAPGNGLTGLRERVDALGGRLTVGPVDGWFTVRAVIPLAAGP
jgi:two-component system, NarL family, sensor histidine kinase DesK